MTADQLPLTLGDQRADPPRPVSPPIGPATGPDLARIASTIPVPVDDGRGCRAYVGETAGQWRVYFARDGGRLREFVGPSFPRDRRGGRTARRLADLLALGHGS